MNIFFEIANHATNFPNEEVCGVIGVEGNGQTVSRRTDNVSSDKANFFRMAPQSYMAAMEELDIIACYHSHTAGRPNLSGPDLAASEELGMPYMLYADGRYTAHTPKDCRRELFGRPYLPLIYDYLTFVADYTEKHWQSPVKLREACYPIDLRLSDALPALILREKLVFENKPRLGDIAVMSLGSGGVPDHLGILEDRGMIAHHRQGKLSESVPYAGTYKQRTNYFLRRKDK